MAVHSNLRVHYAEALATLDIITHHQCSNGGLSSRHTFVDLYGAGVWESDIDPAKRDRAVKIVYRDYLDVFHVEPVSSPDANAVGWMAGGSYVTTQGSKVDQEIKDVSNGARRNFYGAMSLHDRQETQSAYDSLSR